MIEQQHFLHNMSAPPRSQVHVASHRSNTIWVGISFFMPLDGNFLPKVYQRTHCASLDELEDKIAETLEHPDIPEIIAWGPAQNIAPVHPILALGILSKTIGNLYLKSNRPVLSFERLRRSFAIKVPNNQHIFIQLSKSLYERYP